MKMIDFKLVTALAVAAGMSASAAPLIGFASASVTKTYVVSPATDVVGQTADALIRCSGDNPQDQALVPNPGGVCFIAEAGGKIDVTIKDDANPKAGGVYVWLDGSFVETKDPEGVICGSAEGIVVPDGAAYFEVLVGVTNHDNKVPPSVACGVPAPGSHGTVTAVGAVVPTGGGPAPVARASARPAKPAAARPQRRLTAVPSVSVNRHAPRGVTLL